MSCWEDSVVRLVQSPVDRFLMPPLLSIASAYSNTSFPPTIVVLVFLLVVFQLKHNMLFHTARAMCIGWSPDSSKIVSGGIDTNICVWDAKKGEKITMIKGNYCTFTCTATVCIGR